MTKFFLWAILLVLCWPLAIFALLLYPVVWLLLLPFRLVGLVVERLSYDARLERLDIDGYIRKLGHL